MAKEAAGLLLIQEHYRTVRAVYEEVGIIASEGEHL